FLRPDGSRWPAGPWKHVRRRGARAWSSEATSRGGARVVVFAERARRAVMSLTRAPCRRYCRPNCLTVPGQPWREVPGMQSSGCQQRNAPRVKPAPLFLARLLALLSPVAAFGSSDPGWINLPAVAAYRVGHPRPRSCTPPLIQPILFQLFSGRASLLGKGHLKTTTRRRVRPSERERWMRPP